MLLYVRKQPLEFYKNSENIYHSLIYSTIPGFYLKVT
jgi:hypothetical protein